VKATVAILYVASMVCELAGAGLVVGEAKTAGRALRTYLDRGATDASIASVGQLQHANEAITAALGDQTKRRAAVALLFVGIIAGSVANLLTL
jgi:hypothetical protein